jgi:hypothetical protein
MEWQYVKLCNCAQCDCELLGKSMTNLLRAGFLDHLNKPNPLPELVAGRMLGRPYCLACISTPKPKVKPARGWSHHYKTDDDPAQQNAVRELEDAA